MVQPGRSPDDFSADSDHDACPARVAALVPAGFPMQLADGPVGTHQSAIRTRAIGGGVVLEVTGQLSDVVEDLDLAIQLALAEGPRNVVCDLSAVLEGAQRGAVEVLATAGRHVRDWPGTPVAVACPDPHVRTALRAHPLGRHLIVTASVGPALSAMLSRPVPAVEWLRLAPHPTAPHASRNFVTRTLLGWGLEPLIPFACLVVSELVTNSTIHAGTDIDLSVAWDLGALRLTVRDDSSDLPRRRYSRLDVHGRGLAIVAGLSRTFGFFRTADGGKVVWAVLYPPRPRPRRPGPAGTDLEPRVLSDANELGQLTSSASVGIPLDPPSEGPWPEGTRWNGSAANPELTTDRQAAGVRPHSLAVDVAGRARLSPRNA